MNAKLKLAPRKPPDDWEEFRPAAVARSQPRRSATPKLLLLTFLTVVFVLSWLFFQRPIRGTVVQIKRAISELAQRKVASNAARTSTPAVMRRAVRASRVGRGELPDNASRVPGPFEVYLLDGDRYVRVDASSRSVLLNMQTGETTWMESDNVPESRR